MKKSKKMSDEELARRKMLTIKNARAELVKSGIVQFRIEPEKLEILYDLADSKKVRISSLVRDWVNERMHIEQSKGRKTKQCDHYLEEHLSNLFVKEKIDSLEQRIADLESGKQSRSK